MPLVLKRAKTGALESHLSGAVHRWMADLGFIAVEEFTVSWGIADVVGIRPNIDRVLQRMKAGHVESIGDLRTVLILLAIPTEGAKRTISLQELLFEYAELVGREVVEKIVAKLLRKRLIAQTSQGRLHRVVDWLPYHDEIIAVELKLTRIEEAIAQAHRHRVITSNSYVGLPAILAEKVALSDRRIEFEKAKVGLLAVGDDDCEILISPVVTKEDYERAHEITAAETAWRSVLKTIKH